MHGSWFFIGFLVLIFIVWTVTGGPTRPISFAGPFLKPLTPQGATEGYGSLSSFGGGSISGSATSIQRALTSAERELAELQAKYEEAQRFGEPSPYRGLITISKSSTGPRSTEAAKEYVTIKASSRVSTPVSITGWALLSTVTGRAVKVPAGTEIPRAGIINASEPIKLKAGDTAILTSGRPPIGASFRENLCIGYFSQYQTFSPSLPQTCPVPKDELERYYGDWSRDDFCVTFVDRLKRCTLVANVPSNLSSSCSAFITDRFNYNGCVTAHQSERGFLGSTWRVFLGQDGELWKSQRETIKLLDEAGRTVDLYTY